MTAGASAVLVLVGGGAAAVAALTTGQTRIVNAAGRDSTLAAVQPAVPVPPGNGAAQLGAGLGEAKLGAGDANVGAAEADLGLAARTSDEADRTATRTPRRTGTGADPVGSSGGRADATAVPQPPGTAAGPVITTETVTETRPIPYETRVVRDPLLPRGSRRIQTPGIAGEQTLRWLVTRTDGKETDRRLIDTTVTREPQHQVIAFGSQGRGWQHRHTRECDGALDPCLPLGRGACPADGRAEESAVRLGGSLTVLDEGGPALHRTAADGLELDPSLCPEPASGSGGG